MQRIRATTTEIGAQGAGWMTFCLKTGETMTVSRWILLMLIACAGNPSGQANKTTPPTSVAEVFDTSVSASLECATLALAEKMPESSYNFAPTRGEFKGVRTFAQLAKHIAIDNYLSGAGLLGEKPPIESGAHGTGPT